MSIACDGARGSGAEQVRTATRRVRVASILIAAAGLSILAWGLLALLFPQLLIPGFERYTGRSWLELTRVSPHTARFILLAFRLIGALNVAAALPLIVIAITALRRCSRWAWWTLFVGNTIANGAPIMYDQATGSHRRVRGRRVGRADSGVRRPSRYLAPRIPASLARRATGDLEVRVRTNSPPPA
jgi:hypothetical protein